MYIYISIITRITSNMIWGYHGILMGTILENLNQSGRFPVDLPETTAKKGCSVQKKQHSPMFLVNCYSTEFLSHNHIDKV